MKNYYDDVGEAVRSVELGESWGAMYITENFTDAFVARIALGNNISWIYDARSSLSYWIHHVLQNSI